MCKPSWLAKFFSQIVFPVIPTGIAGKIGRLAGLCGFATRQGSGHGSPECI